MNDLIEKIKALDDYGQACYYICHLKSPLWRYFSGMKWNGIPFYIERLCIKAKTLINQSNLSQEEILKFIANNNPCYFFVAQSILVYGISGNLNECERYDIISNKMHLPDNIIIDENILSCAVVGFVLDTNKYNDWDFESIVSNEQFAYSINDYKLTKVSDLDFRQNGFIYDDKYYLYNIFIDRKTIENNDKMPAIFRLINDTVDLSKADLYLRLDERLAFPLEDVTISQSFCFEKFRGFSFKYADTKLEKIKNIIVHYDPNTFNKLLMVIKKDFDKILNCEFWHVELESLPYIDITSKVKNICTTFIHGKYYPNQNVFKHIDYIKNQYPFEKYCLKQEDRSNENIQIDYYTTKNCHYKVWCIENIDISEENWYKLASISLPEQYRNLLDEILEKTQ
uniref:hypothetical protein n=1 Tax=Clostridium butyricum TaxID=1492 RepID=UPI001FB10013|nr:hypothetical protein [Clostridium butyricum]